MKVLVTGCAGFIGCHLAEYFLNAGNEVTGLDNLSRKGGEENLRWLQSLQGNFKFCKRKKILQLQCQCMEL